MPGKTTEYRNIMSHSPYTSNQVLTNQLNIHHELSNILIPSFIQSVHDNLPQVFIEPIGFTVESIPKDIILYSLSCLRESDGIMDYSRLLWTDWR